MKKVIKKIALASFLISYCSMSYPMEIPSVELTEQQEEALKCCDFIKHCKPQAAAGERISFKPNAFMTASNIAELIKVINDIKYLDQIKNEALFTQLFELADFLQAPENISEALANRAYPSVQKNVTALEKEIEAIKEQNQKIEQLQRLSDLRLLKDTIAINLPYYLDFTQFMADVKGKENWLEIFKKNFLGDSVINNYNYNIFFLSRISKALKITKKIRSLEGIEVLKEFGQSLPLDQIEQINIFDEPIKTFSVKALKKVFPHSKSIYLSKNGIESVSNKEIDEDIERISLPNNPLASVCLDNPAQYKKLLLNAAHTPLNPQNIIFKQTSLAKMLFWLKSFAAKSNIVAFKGIKKERLLLCLFGACAGMCAVTIKEYFGNKSYAATVKFLKNNFEYLIRLGLITGYLTERIFAFLEKEIKTNLENAANQNPYHVRVLTPSNGGSDNIKTDFPTKYSYKLW